MTSGWGILYKQDIKSLTIKGKTDKLNFIDNLKIEKFFSLIDTTKRIKKHAME